VRRPLRAPLLALLLACACSGDAQPGDRITLEFWALGREGELVRELVSRVEGLGELLAYETTLASETTELEYKAAADR